MAYCPNCGDPAQEGQKFCSNCGFEYSPKKAEEVTATVVEESGKRPSCDGVFSLSWEDLKSSKNWFWRCLLLGVLLAVPIVNFFVLGYLGRWGVMAAFRQGDKLEGSIFTSENFKVGFFVFVMLLVMGAASSVAAAVPLVGWLAFVFVLPFGYICITRMLVIGDLSDAFKMKDIWNKFKDCIGGVLFLYWLPCIILAVAGVAIAVVAGTLSVAGALGTVGILSTLASGSGLGAGLLAGLGVGGGLVALVCAVVACVAGVVTDALILRNLGYWVSRFAPDWVKEALEKGHEVK